MGIAIAGSLQKLQERPFFTLCMCPNSPLEIHDGASQVIIETAKASLPISILSMGLAGGTTPATLTGTFCSDKCGNLGGHCIDPVDSRRQPGDLRQFDNCHGHEESDVASGRAGTRHVRGHGSADGQILRYSDESGRHIGGQ